jgi:hypothetical protein
MLGSFDTAIGFCTKPLDGIGGFTYTLTTLLGVFLREAERRYGPRDKNWTPLGIEFGGTVPQIWYPGNCGNISIMLTESARHNPSQAIFQLAHETIHLLSPLGKRAATVFEEGLATAFADDMSPRYGSTCYTNHPSYLTAKSLTVQFLLIYPDGIKHMRGRVQSFNQFTIPLIMDVCPTTPVELAVALCQPFVRGDC